MQELNIVSLILTLLHLAAATLFIYSCENFYVAVSFVIFIIWVAFTGLTLEIADNSSSKWD